MCGHKIFFCRAEIFKLGFFVQIYSNQSVLCRNIGQVPLRVTQSCEAVYLDQTKPKTMYMDTIFILFLVPLFTKNGAKLTCCMIGGKLLISPCRKNAFFGFSAEILLFRAEILPCGPPLLPHSCAEPFLGVVQKYSFLGDIFTSAPSRIELHCTSKRGKNVAKSSPLKYFFVQELFVSNGKGDRLSALLGRHHKVLHQTD